jgi:hypothetical protein
MSHGFICMNLRLYLHKFPNYTDSMYRMSRKKVHYAEDRCFAFSTHGPEDFYMNCTLKLVLESPRFSNLLP